VASPATKEQLLLEDQKAFLPLPATSFAACRQFSTTVSSLSLARFDNNDYSVPVRWAHQPVVVQSYCQQVVLYAQGLEIARHKRIWEKEQVCFEPLHYLALLEKKPGALDHARPLAGWNLPECFGRVASAFGGWNDWEKARGNTSGCCGCWRSILYPNSVMLWNRHWP